MNVLGWSICFFNNKIIKARDLGLKLNAIQNLVTIISLHYLNIY